MIPELQPKHLENIVYYNRSKPKGAITLEVNQTDIKLKEINPYTAGNHTKGSTGSEREFSNNLVKIEHQYGSDILGKPLTPIIAELHTGKRRV